MRGLIVLGLVVSLSAFCQSPTIFNNGVVDAANFTPQQQIAPGGLAAIFGSDLAGALTLADSIPLATQLADVRVTFNNIPAPLLAAIPSGPGNPAQVNAQVPWNVLPQGVSAGTASVVVSRGSTVVRAASGPGRPRRPWNLRVPLRRRPGDRGAADQ